MKKLGFLLMAICILGFAAPAFSADFAFHGDLNHRFVLYTDHADWFNGEHTGRLHDGEVDDMWGEIKYRLWMEAGSDDGAVKGVVATEIGGLRFGEPSAMTYSGDQIRFEVRWGYLDFQIPGVEQKSRLRTGLMPFTVNEYVWQETVGGVDFYGSTGVLDYELAWVRGYEVELTEASTEDDAHEDVDAFLARINVSPADKMKAGLFGLYQNNDGGADAAAVTPARYEVKLMNNVDFDIWTVGTDGNYEMSGFFFKWDLMYQGGTFNEATFAGVTDDFDLSAWFGHLDVGMNMGKNKLTYTVWYASGDDDDDDDEFNGFLATDVDRADSIIIMEGNFADDDYFTERPYILDKGLIFNKLALDSKLNDKMTVGAAVIYMMTAEDIEYTDSLGRDQSDDGIGLEFDAYMKYMLYESVEFSLNAGYLWADDAMDYFEVGDIQDGESDEDIFITSARIRYKF